MNVRLVLPLKSLHEGKTRLAAALSAKDRAALSAELKALCHHPLTYVKVRAMGAYARWDPEGAREVCLAGRQVRRRP